MDRPRTDWQKLRCTTEVLRSGANMYHVKEMLGNESLDTLKHYARLTITDLKKAHAKCHPRRRKDDDNRAIRLKTRRF